MRLARRLVATMFRLGMYSIVVGGRFDISPGGTVASLVHVRGRKTCRNSVKIGKAALKEADGRRCLVEHGLDGGWRPLGHGPV